MEEATDCARHAHHLPALARGLAPADELIALRAHLRACGACRARLHELREPAA
ncbi:MAG: zf-HC2 domain-containing protein [Solirubrobacteraceae bacterium]